MKRLIFPLLAILVTSAAAQTTTKLAATKANDYGIVYSLPLTGLQISLTAQGTVSTPGEFYQYAERYLGAQAARKAISVASSKWTITSVAITPVGVPQTSGETYLMQFKAGTPTYLLINEQGLPLSLGIETADSPMPAPFAPAHTESASPLDGAAARYAMTEDIIQSSSLAKRAAMAAQQIMELRQSRQDYLTGQADQMPDGAALKIILDNINAQEEALTAMFIGTTVTRTATFSTIVTPPRGNVTDMVIARLNQSTGFVTADDLSGNPVYLNLNVTDSGTLPVTDKGEAKKMPKNGVAYCIPGTAIAAIDYEGKVYASRTFSIAQDGVVFGLDPSMFTDKKNPAYVIFDTTTGGIRELGTK